MNKAKELFVRTGQEVLLLPLVRTIADPQTRKSWEGVSALMCVAGVELVNRALVSAGVGMAGKLAGHWMTQTDINNATLAVASHLLVSGGCALMRCTGEAYTRQGKLKDLYFA